MRISKDYMPIVCVVGMMCLGMAIVSDRSWQLIEQHDGHVAGLVVRLASWLFMITVALCGVLFTTASDKDPIDIFPSAKRSISRRIED